LGSVSANALPALRAEELRLDFSAFVQILHEAPAFVGILGECGHAHEHGHA